MTHKSVVSFVLVGRDGLVSIDPLLTSLAEQSVAMAAEVVAVVPDGLAPSTVPERYKLAFQDFKIVTVPAIRSRGVAAAAGIRVATGPIVSLFENHCFPAPDCVEKVLAEFDLSDETLFGVAPATQRANPESLLGTAIYAVSHAEFSEAIPGGEMAEMPVHNCCYRRDALMRHEFDLDRLMGDEKQLQAQLRADGGRFVFTPEARCFHLNDAVWDIVLKINWINGRRYGGDRSVDWSPMRRVAYAALFPLLGLKVHANTMATIQRTNPSEAGDLRLKAVVLLQSLAHALGEAGGYLFGRRSTFKLLEDEEFMILERLGGRVPEDPWIARLVSDAEPLHRPGRERVPLRRSGAPVTS